MSLINEMLRDLEARRTPVSMPELQHGIRPVPPGRRRPGAAALPGLVALLGAGLGAAAWLRTGALEETPQPPPATAAAAPASDPSPFAGTLRLATSLAAIPPAAPPATPPVPARDRSAAARGAGEPAAVPAAGPAATGDANPAPGPKSADLPANNNGIEKTLLPASPREKADAEYRHAQALLAAGQPAAAQAVLAAALSLDGGHVPARQALLRLLIDQQRMDEAVAVLQAGQEQQPAQLGWAMSLARLLVERGDIAAAEGVLRRSAGYGAGNAEYAGFHGHLLDRLGQFRAAADQYRQAARLAPSDGRWWFGLGAALAGDGQAEAAREAFRRALATGNLNTDLTALAERRLR